MQNQEQYECGNCYFVGPLNLHGGCGRCNSQAVLSLERVGLLIRETIETRQRVLAGIPLDLANPLVVERAGYWLQRCRERNVAQ
jgi:hypothetical protein